MKGMNPQGGMKRRWTREGEMMLSKLRATYTNMIKDEDEDEDEEDKASRHFLLGLFLHHILAQKARTHAWPQLQQQIDQL